MDTQICLDGKTLKGSRINGKAAHLLTAYVAEAHLVLAQIKVDDKSNEITAIPEILNLLDIKGAVITIDAMGCQKAIAQTIIEGNSRLCAGLER